mmetsp:Transcript_80578/g.228261  ORF Transcript_80578/g.228261 Transcript_80578/m.228261 type:complete len:332 (-) Transcript_80578:585-1580(-)
MGPGDGRAPEVFPARPQDRRRGGRGCESPRVPQRPPGQERVHVRGLPVKGRELRRLGLGARGLQRRPAEEDSEQGAAAAGHEPGGAEGRDPEELPGRVRLLRQGAPEAPARQRRGRQHRGGVLRLGRRGHRRPRGRRRLRGPVRVLQGACHPRRHARDGLQQTSRRPEGREGGADERRPRGAAGRRPADWGQRRLQRRGERDVLQRRGGPLLPHRPVPAIPHRQGSGEGPGANRPQRRGPRAVGQWEAGGDAGGQALEVRGQACAPGAAPRGEHHDEGARLRQPRGGSSRVLDRDAGLAARGLRRKGAPEHSDEGVRVHGARYVQQGEERR